MHNTQNKFIQPSNGLQRATAMHTGFQSFLQMYWSHLLCILSAITAPSITIFPIFSPSSSSSSNLTQSLPQLPLPRHTNSPLPHMPSTFHYNPPAIIAYPYPPPRLTTYATLTPHLPPNPFPHLWARAPAYYRPDSMSPASFLPSLPCGDNPATHLGTTRASNFPHPNFQCLRNLRGLRHRT